MVDHNADATLTATAYLPVAQEQEQRSLLSIPRFLYESDGTYVTYLRSSESSGTPTSGGWVNYGLAYWEQKELNGWGNGRWPHDSAYETYQYVFVFPELRDLKYAMLGTRIYGGVGGNPYYRFYWSSNTTNGFDGTWTQVTVNTTVHISELTYNGLRKIVPPNYLNLTGVRGIRVFNDHALSGWPYDSGGLPHMIHFYGYRTGEASRLAFWHPTLDQEVSGTWFDFGNFLEEKTQTFRVKNLSPDKRSLGTIISIEASGDSWDASSYYSFSDGGAYARPLNIGILDSNEISDVITLRGYIPRGTHVAYVMNMQARPTAWYQWYQSTTASMTASGVLTAPSRNVDWNAQAVLTADMVITDSALYRNSGQYRDAKIYRPSGIVMTWAGVAALTANTLGDTYGGEYRDAYGNAGLYAEAYNTFQKATTALTAGALGDNYDDLYDDVYGNSGLYATATVT